MTTTTIYVGSVKELSGRPVVQQEHCHCPECAEAMFRCQRCSDGAEYTWASCPHAAPQARLNLLVLDGQGARVRLAHARAGSVRLASSIALVPSGRYAHLSTAICRACLWSTMGYCDPAALAGDVEAHRARCTSSVPTEQTAARTELNRRTLEHFDRTGQGWV